MDGSIQTPASTQPSTQKQPGYTFQSNRFLTKNPITQFDVKHRIIEAYRYIKSECKTALSFQSYASIYRTMKKCNPVPAEIFTSLIVMDLLSEHKLDPSIKTHVLNYLQKQHSNGQFYFFEDHSLLPPDIDCISYGVPILFKSSKLSDIHVHRLLDQIVKNTNEDGIIKVYFDPTNERPHVDPFVCVNALYLFYFFGRDKEIQETENFVFEILKSKDYLKGSRYYPSPDSFLFFLTRVTKISESFKERFQFELRLAIKERIFTTEFPLDLAMRVLCCKRLKLPFEKEKKILSHLQRPTGKWPADAFFKTGKQKIYFGSSILSTAFSILALEE